jgi:predicted enzyme related to lactoylglutathione lyase
MDVGERGSIGSPLDRWERTTKETRMSATTPGSFVWYDLFTTDPRAAIAFYGKVLGWTSTPMENNANYSLFANHKGPLAGVEALPETAKKMGAPPHWVGHVQVENVDAAVAKVKELGGRALVDPFDIPHIGRDAFVADPHGASVAVFTPSREMTTRDANEAGEVCWHELMSAEHEGAFVFYNKLFGWKKSSDFDMGAMGKYLLFGNGGPDLGGMFTKRKEVPVSAWLYYFQVPDLDAALERVKANGGRVHNGPMEVPTGARIAQLADPQGVMFALHANPPK